MFHVEAEIARLVGPCQGAALSVGVVDGPVVLAVPDLLERLRTFRHNDDQHHNGETVLEHIDEVRAAISRSTYDWPERRREILRLTAVLHDLGKAYTYRYEGGKHTFRGHAAVSIQIASLALQNHLDIVDVADLVEFHDVFWALDNARTTSTKYLRKFAKHSLSYGAWLDNLVTFALADTAHAKAHHEVVASIQQTLDDLRRYRAEEALREAAEARLAQLRASNLVKYRAEIAQLVEDAVPGASWALPDLHEVNRALGQAKQFAVIKAVQAILVRE